MNSNRLATIFYGLLLYVGQVVAEPEEVVKMAPLETSQLVQTLLGLTVVLALIVGLAWGVKRFGRIPGAGSASVKVEGGVSLGPRERAVLLNVEGTRLLVGVAPGRVQMLHVVSPPLSRRQLAEELAFEEDLLNAVNDGVQS